MNKTIYEYELYPQDTQTVLLPKDAVVLSAQQQRGSPVLWALVDTEETVFENAVIDIFGTGNPYVEPECGHSFIGTVVMDSGLVWHVFGRNNA